MEYEKKTGRAIAEDITVLTCNTPLVRINRMTSPDAAEILAKLEYFSPAGSVKDRVAMNMIKKGEEAGLIKKGTVVIESTSGNTGIGVAMICAAKGYRCVIVMPDSMSLERTFILKRFGAEVVLTPAKDGLEGAARKVLELARKEKDAFIPHQFENTWNPDVHRMTTAREIWEATQGRLDAFVAGVGTGGTITGVGEVFKAHDAAIRIVAVEPQRSPVLSQGKTGTHKIQGIGAGFVPKVLNRAIIDEIKTVRDEDAFETMKRLAAEEGILAGISSGAAMFAALEVARNLGAQKRVIVILPDTGERYLTVQHYFEF